MSTNLLISGYAWACAAGLFAIALINSWTSRINQFFFFSRTVQPGFDRTSAARQITTRYLMSIWLGFGGGLLLFAATLLFSRLSVLLCFTLAVLLQVLIANLAFARAHRATGEALAASPALPAAEPGIHQPQETISVPLLQPVAFSKKLVTLLFLAPAIAAAVWLGAMYATHFSLDQFSSAIEANKADFLSGMGMGMLTAGIFMYILLRYFSRHRSPMGFLTANLIVLCAWIGALLIAFAALTVPLHFVITRTTQRSLLGAVLALALLRILYGWMRNRLFPPTQVERNGDSFWRWGLFYYNPSDPTLFIQCRSGHGYTVNFANFLSWPLLLLFLADLVFLISRHPLR